MIRRLFSWLRLKWRNNRALRRGDGFSTGVYLWLDDERPAPKGWYWAKTFDEAADILESCFVERVSLDHDLGNGPTGYDLVIWLTTMREAQGLNFWPIDQPRIHSMNPVGRKNMRETIERYGGYEERHGGFTPRWHHEVKRP